ncbi:MAG: hypothetical protein JNL14_14335 [Devosia sp.]|uniref:hypothetical protein n=1 Tax=Devosia sp. TaxID=1871048 RepID=UPI001A41C231|nr:hypothetical protein [Devosia sp.]MBL8598909.1 hypothetical protein [Devosia sp.]
MRLDPSQFPALAWQRRIKLEQVSILASLENESSVLCEVPAPPFEVPAEHELVPIESSDPTYVGVDGLKTGSTVLSVPTIWRLKFREQGGTAEDFDPKTIGDLCLVVTYTIDDA